MIYFINVNNEVPVADPAIGVRGGGGLPHTPLFQKLGTPLCGNIKL